MDGGTREQLRQLWNQTAIPVLYRRGPGNPLLVRLPFDPTNRAWLQISGRKNPLWDARAKSWELPQGWFNDLVTRCLERFGRAYIVQPYREQEKCAPACWTAQGEVCECSCMGVNHGASSPGGHWKIVSEAFATRWGERQFACRLLARPSQ